MVSEVQECHLFTDGSAHGSRHRLHQLEAWAVVDASIDQCVARGSLGGSGQGSDKAELRAIIAAVDYALDQSQTTYIWTDCSYVAEGTMRLLQDPEDVPDGKHHEDWLELQGLLCQCDKAIFLQHIPGHAHWDHADQDLDQWLARWNDRADREANMAMKLHAEELLHLHRLLLQHQDNEMGDLQQLQKLHIAVMHFQKTDDAHSDACRR